jgi:hypothetical protein
MHDNAIDHPNLQDALDFILDHFQEPLFPRKIMTKRLGYQVEVFDKQEALEYFKVQTMEIVESMLIHPLRNTRVSIEHR